MPLFELHLKSSILWELNPTVIQSPPAALRCTFRDINQDFAMSGPSAHESVPCDTGDLSTQGFREQAPPDLSDGTPVYLYAVICSSDYCSQTDANVLT